MPAPRRLFYACAACLCASPALAQSTGNVQFNGVVLDSCIVVVGTPGLLQPNAQSNALSSAETGGLPGLATVTATSADFDLEVDPPVAFASAPAGAETNAAFAASYSAAGATNATDTPAGAPTSLGFGVTAVTVNASATKSAGAFPAGAYQLETVVRCVAS
ncbi:MAG: hypothetical protein ACFB00_12350 [Parvularculaceae bacterium]